jgi:hypothetical protein
MAKRDRQERGGRSYSSGSVVNISGKPARLPRSVASVALVSATSFV